MSIQVNNLIIGPGVGQSQQPLAPVMAQASADAALEHAKAARASDAELEAQLQEALQKTGIKAEIEYRANGHMVFRIVDQETQFVEFQIPTETVLSLIESLNQAARNREIVSPGAFIDEQA